MKLLIRSLLALSFCLSFLLLLSLAASAQSPAASNPAPATKASTSDDATAIRAVLDAQVAAWNAGKLEEFMTGYWRSPKLTFFSGGRKLESWDATLERYRKNYQSEGKEMGKLQFLDLDIQTFGTGAVVRGRFELTMSDGKKPTGLFTLVFRKFNKDWKIIHDHTSTN